MLSRKQRLLGAGLVRITYHVLKERGPTSVQLHPGLLDQYAPFLDLRLEVRGQACRGGEFPRGQDQSQVVEMTRQVAVDDRLRRGTGESACGSNG